MTFFAPLEMHSIPNDPTPENKSKTFELISSQINFFEWFIILKIILL